MRAHKQQAHKQQAHKQQAHKQQAGNHLVVFVKQPRLGRVKTRLAADIGAVAAWRFYRAMLGTVLPPLARDRRWRTWLAVTPDGAPGPWPVAVPTLDQGPGDLGARMARPFQILPPGPVVIVGTDVPAVTPARVARAFRALGGHDAVFGPATDGGYWLVGMRRTRPAPDLFAGVRWSTRHALADTLANLAGRRVALVDTLSDVDDGAAYDAWTRRGPE